ncbi:hypothetical protein [Actinoplanes sp. HUAS TT8]|uniref:hypothetical protein n=1 Tax=Actinoplanes sp. HUAS TT8 TaxID=3447453 RepID=UPI003F528F3E
MHFVYRSHYEGPLSKLVRRLPDATVLDWFRRNWERPDPWNWIQDELGANVYGLSTIFEAAREHRLPPPADTGQLRALLHEHLYVEGDTDYIRVDEHSVRVRTDDDEVELAYFFLDDEVIARYPDRLAYLVHESWPLPDEAGGEPAAGPTTHAVFLTFYDGASLEVEPPVTIPGTGLDGLATSLRRGDDERWPAELRILAALIAQGEPGPDAEALAVALRRATRWPGFGLDADESLRDGELEHAVDLVLTAPIAEGRKPEASLILVGRHLAQMAMHCSTEFGFQQWFLFDDVWAAAYPDLAASLLRYASGWDPLDGTG